MAQITCNRGDAVSSASRVPWINTLLAISSMDRRVGKVNSLRPGRFEYCPSSLNIFRLPFLLLLPTKLSIVALQTSCSFRAKNISCCLRFSRKSVISLPKVANRSGMGRYRFSNLSDRLQDFYGAGPILVG